MSKINQTYNDRVKYILAVDAPGWEPLEGVDPEGWQDDEKELARNLDYHGIFPNFSNNLFFVEDAADYITSAKKILGVNTEIKLTKYEQHPQTDKWFRTYWGYLDLMEYKVKNKKVSIKFNSGGLEQLIKAREADNVEVDRLDTMDGQPLAELPVNEVALDGRRIFLKSKWEHNPNLVDFTVGVYSDDGNTRSKATGFPLNLVSRSHEQAHSVIPESYGNENGGSTGMMILADFDRTRELKVKGRGLKIKPFIYNGYTPGIGVEWNWAFFKVCLTVYEGSIDFNVKQRIPLLHFGHGTNDGALIYNSNVLNIHNNLLSIPDFEKDITVDQGDSVAIEILIKADLKNYATSRARYYVRMSEIDGDVFVEEDSHFEPSKSKFILMHDLFDRLAKICTSKQNVFYSKYFGRTDLGYAADGPGAFIGVSHGFWIRGFDKLPLSTENDPNLFKPLTTSFRDAIVSSEAVLNVGMGIEEINGRERIRVEDSKYFYNNNVLIRLPNQVKNVERSTAKDYFFSSIQIGYDKGGNYEEAQGLDEPNGTSSFTTVITKQKKTFEQISTYRSDSYGKEFCRRKPASLDSTLDTQYDEDIWIQDLKKGITNIYQERKYQDDFEQAPTGIYSPETATNLRFSPFNMLLRHSWFIASGFLVYPTDYVRYGSSTANSNLKTKLNGKPEYAENGNIINSELQRARFDPEWIEFEHECTFDVMRQVFGNTVIQGEEIPNFYGLVEFTNEDNEIEKGFLFNLKPNGNGKWKILKANR